MFFAEAVRSKVVSKLRPWLEGEPETELELGFLRSHGKAKNLSFDPSALNPLIEDSSRLVVKSFKVRELQVRIAPCSRPSVALEVRGVNVTLAPRESDGKRRLNPGDLAKNRRNKVIASLDPQGVSVHEMIERLSAKSSLGKSFLTSLSDTMLRCCQIGFHDIEVHLQFIGESHACILRVNDISLEPELLNCCSLFGGLLRSIIPSGKESILALSCSSVEIRLKDNNHTNCITSLVDLSASVRLNNLCLLGSGVHVSLLNFNFSPNFVPSLLIILDALSFGFDGFSGGQELWKKAVQKIRYSALPKDSLHRTINIVVLWLRYVHAYESLLLLVGFTAGKESKENMAMVSNDYKKRSQVKSQLKLVNELEEKLPAEAVARARLIARYRISLHPCSTDLISAATFVTTLMSKIVALVSLLWKFIYSIYQSVAHLSLIFTVSSRRHAINNSSALPLGDVSRDSVSQLYFGLSLGEINFTLSPATVDYANISAKLQQESQIHYDNVPSLCLTIKYFCIICMSDSITKSMFIAFGELKTNLSYSSRVSPLRSDLGIKRNSSFKALGLNTGIESNTVLWSDPALPYHSSESCAIDCSNLVDDAPISVMESVMGDLWSSWKEVTRRSEGINVHHVEHPFFLCEFQNFLMDPYLGRGDCGLQKCNLSLGKLNLDLEYLSILSIVSLSKQMQLYYHWTSNIGNMQSLSASSCVNEEKPNVRVEGRIKLYPRRIKLALLKMIPCMNIQIGAFIAGPRIRIELQEWQCKQDMSTITAKGIKKYSFVFDLANVEFAVWPASKDVLSALTRDSSFSSTETEYIWLKEPLVVDNLEAYGNERYNSRGRVALNTCLKLVGLSVSIHDLAVNQQSYVVRPLSITIQSSTCKDCLHSISATMNAVSLTLTGNTTGVYISIYLDEFWTFLQVLEVMLSASSSDHMDFDSLSPGYSEDLVRKLMMTSAKKDTRRKSVESIAAVENLITKNPHILVSISFELDSIDIILNVSRQSHSSSKGSDSASSSAITNVNSSSTCREKRIRDILNFLNSGIGVFIQKTCIGISCSRHLSEVQIDLSGIQSVIFDLQSQIGAGTDTFEIMNLLDQSFSNSYQFYLSDCIFSLQVGSHSGALPVRSGVDCLVSDNCRTSYEEERLNLYSDESESHSCGSNRNLEAGRLLMRNTTGEGSLSWAIVDITLGEFVMAEYCVKNLLTVAHSANKLQMSISACEERQTTKCKLQGGYIFLETASIAKFLDCYKTYYWLIMNYSLWGFSGSGRSYTKAGKSTVSENSFVKPANHSSAEYSIGTLSSASDSEKKWDFECNFFQVLDVEIHQSRLILAVKDGSGGFQELVVEADMSLQLLNHGKTLLFALSRLTIFTQCLHGSMLYQTRQSPVTCFHSNTSVASSSQSRSDERSCTSQLSCHDEFHPAANPAPRQEILVKDAESGLSTFCHGGYVLKHLAGSIEIEMMLLDDEVGLAQLKSNWVGNGFVSGFDLTVTLSQIQMLLSLSLPLSGKSGGKASESLMRNIGPINEGWMKDKDCTFPDGAIVAIKDFDQHMYIAVEAVDQRYRLVGTLHYSLVRERALFRVRYHKLWRSRLSWISFESLYAKSEGKPLCLSYCPGSGFVEISSSNDKQCAFWQIFPYEPENYEDDGDEMEHYNITFRNAFYLVNRKNNCGVAFVDGLPEFVKKPGNPFKGKVFNEFTIANDLGALSVSSNYSGNTGDRDVRECSSYKEGGRSRLNSNYPYVVITFDKVALTILHEVSETNDKFPLFRGCINNIQVIVQMSSSKLRIMGLFDVAVHYFEARSNLWREFISPVDVSLFFRSRRSHQVSGNGFQGVPVHFFLGVKKVNISLTELSLDTLLYLVGKLDIAGPYAVRSSVIFPNRCKLENNLALSLLCRFSENHDVMIDGTKSASVFLRHDALVGQSKESENSVSVSIAEQEVLSTSPINISLSAGCLVAWRTRVVSLKDSRSFPGPFIVAEVSKKAEEGLSVIISPLLRIHNATEYSLELRFQRPHETEGESASVLLRSGDTIDDSVAVSEAIDLSGGSKRALMSLSVGNFVLYIRPKITGHMKTYGESVSANWSEGLEGGKAVCLSGVLDKLSYRVKKAFGVKSRKIFFSTLRCPIVNEDQHVSDLYFLVRTVGRDVPVMQPPSTSNASETKTLPAALQIQKEVCIYPTVQVYNLLQTEILVLLTDSHPDLYVASDRNDIGKQAIVPCGSSVYLYANPSMIYFSITLTAYNSKCKPVNSGDWVKKLNKQKSEARYLDIELEFSGRKYFASLRLSRAERGTLEIAVFTSHTLQNNTELFLLCSASNQKSLPWTNYGKYDSDLPPELGCLLPPKSVRSWFLKSNKVLLRSLEEKTSVAFLDLDVLSGFTELCLEAQDDVGISRIEKLGISSQPCVHDLCVPSQVVCIVQRYIIQNESTEAILVRQCYQEDDIHGITSIEGKQRVTVKMRRSQRKRRETGFFDSILRRHKNGNEDYHFFFQFCPKENGYSWSGPICISSLGRFYLKFKQSSTPLPDQMNPNTTQKENLTRFATAWIQEEGSSLVLQFYMPPNVALPYRIENCLNGVSIMYYQKDSIESELLGPGDSTEYVWDDLNLPHKLIVQIVDMHLLREINIDKVCTWKPFFKMRQNRGLLHLPSDKSFGFEKRTSDESFGLRVLKVGYEVYADGLTRVLRICELAHGYKAEALLRPCANFQMRISDFALHILENNKQDIDANELPIYSTIIVARLTNIALSSLTTDQYTFNCMNVQSISVDEKWQGAPFASLVRKSQLHDTCSDENILHIIFVLRSTNSNVKQVKYSSIVLQPIDLRVDEETLMRLVPFWRTSLNDSRAPSQQFYFKHFEIHPIKIIASFLPGSEYTTYSSAQETLRSLLHSVIKVPAVDNRVVELNGILLTHALVTLRELVIKCAQHYSWYAVRAVYIAKGSPLLPPAFASIFDDTASSSLDVFFDPSDGSVSLPGLTLGMFKFISKSINSKGFSGTKRYFGDLGKTIKMAGSNALFAAVTEISDTVLRGAETNGFSGMVNGLHQGILRLAMEPSLLGAAVMEGGPDRKIKLDRSPGVDELYIEGYLQAMLDVMYKQEYLRVRVIDDQVLLKNLPPNSSVINEIVENVKSFLMSKALLKGDASTASRPLRHLRMESEWKLGPTVLTLCEHLFVGFAIGILKKQATKFMAEIKWKGKTEDEDKGEASSKESQAKLNKVWAVGKFVMSGMIAYLDGRLCRHIPHPIARRIVSGFLLSFLDKKDGE